MSPKNSFPASWQAGEKLTQHAKNALKRSETIAQSFHCLEISSLHLLLAILEETGSLGKSILEDMKLTSSALESAIKKDTASPERELPSIIPLNKNVKEVILKAYLAAKNFQYPYVGTEHLVYAIFSLNDPIVNQVLPNIKGKDQKNSEVNQTLQSFFRPNELANLSKVFQIPEISLSQNVNPETIATPFLNNFCRNLNEEVVKNKEFFIGRARELERLIHILGRKQKNNPLLIGEPGVGKTALVSQLAQKVNEGRVPDFLLKKTIMNLDVAALIAGTSFRGEFEARLREIIQEAKRAGNIILFIDEIHNIVGAGNIAGSLDLANILKPALARGEIHLIGATTFSEYKRHIEKDAALARRFQTVPLNEPTPSEAKEIIGGLLPHLEKFHRVNFASGAAETAVNLSISYLPERFLPDKAIDILDESASRLKSRRLPDKNRKELPHLESQLKELRQQKEKLVSEEKFDEAENILTLEEKTNRALSALHEEENTKKDNHKPIITLDQIRETVSSLSGVPKEKMAQEKNHAVKNIEKILKSKVIGQSEAIEKISFALKRAYAGIHSGNRPMGSFLFLGPTGVGKTHTAKMLAEHIFGQEKNLIRFDMSELSERHQTASLIGAPAGYVGYGEGGRLTEKIRRQPYSVVLFDEIEKAHPEIINIFLQILEDGHLTDAEGLEVSFRHAIIIFTSNVGSNNFAREGNKLGFHSVTSKKNFAGIKEDILNSLKNQFRPEFLDRLDNIVVFEPLEEKEISSIARLMLKDLQKNLQERSINLKLDKKLPALIAQLIKNSSDEKSYQGAREIRKYIQTHIENPLADLVLGSDHRPLTLYARVNSNKKIQLQKN